MQYYELICYEGGKPVLRRKFPTYSEAEEYAEKNCSSYNVAKAWRGLQG